MLFRIDGALEPWLTILSDTIMELYPLPDTTPIIPSSKVPQSRVVLKHNSTARESAPHYFPDSLSATIITNTRTTAKDWNQDVRHIELQLDEDVE